MNITLEIGKPITPIRLIKQCDGRIQTPAGSHSLGPDWLKNPLHKLKTMIYIPIKTVDLKIAD